MRNFLILFLLTCSLVVFGNDRTKFSFNAGWKLHIGDAVGAENPTFDTREWKEVTLPYAWNAEEAFAKPIHEHSTDIVWYRKSFAVPKGVVSDKVFLEFEGIRHGGEFYLNGKFIGRHENGVMGFGLDLSDALLSDQENVLAVRIDNSWSYREKATNSTYQWNDKNFNANYGGIPKNVWIHFTAPIYQTLPLYSNLKTTGVYVYAKNMQIDNKSIDLFVESEVKNETKSSKQVNFVVEVRDIDQQLVKTFSKGYTLQPGSTNILKANAPIKDVNFWSWGYGYLYTVTSKVVVDERVVDAVDTKTGFRKTAFREGMVYLNDKVLMMKGYAQRTSNEWPALGLSVAPWLSDYSNRLMVESNANLVRWMHVTPWKQDVESCDRVGLMQMLPAGDAERDVDGRRWEQRTELMRDAIIYYRNSPSVLFYECGNESISEAHMAEMIAIRDQYDPHGGRAIGSREMLDSKIAEYGGEMLYTNKSNRHPMIATEYMRDEGLRKYWDEYTYPYHKDGEGPLYKGNDASDYNRNQDSHAVEAVKRWWEYWTVRPGTGKRVSSGGVNIIFSDSNTHYRGKENYRRSGEVDAMRIPKDAFYAHQVMWNGWVETDPTGLHIVGHWNYMPEVKKDIFVIAAGEKVELFINGVSQGFGERSYNFLFTFSDIAFQTGELSAKSYAEDGTLLAEKVIQTADVPYRVKLKYVHGENGLYADGNDMVMVDVEVVDHKGNRSPTALNMIDFQIEGPMEWKGGIAQGPNNYILSESLPVEAGINRVLLRTRYGKTGTVKIKAMSNGLQADSVQFEVSPVKATDDYFVKESSMNLPLNLSRGAGPTGSTVVQTRETLRIKRSTAGANTETGINSYDSNELSDWVNDGKLSTAWIEYTLDKKSDINEIDLKLNNFRSRSYPLQIFVDDKLVYEGNTPTTLGYCTLSFPRTKGQRVKIQLAKSSYVASENKHEEIGGKKLDDGVQRDDTNAKGTLSIIEIDIHNKK
ncbi:sugar-binding domain-containing protein [Sphingobacterium pedocola]|uniref:Beta-galactosidase n=1 Tax=Sphingobacterium pedocola TaxID=2082722 RepID=A0ABR9TA79_9SPHI|nr:sugar-binding domain-containing protein [Sphingobacterium pedocola]MBE8722240.1 beta-galactosidase [Sphingobacterium pedocola]